MGRSDAWAASRLPHQPTSAPIHAAAIRIARRCRNVIQCLLREEEWAEADREFYLIAREELEKNEAGDGRGHHPEA
jgi:hypothetical protein